MSQEGYKLSMTADEISATLNSAVTKIAMSNMADSVKLIARNKNGNVEIHIHAATPTMAGVIRASDYVKIQGYSQRIANIENIINQSIGKVESVPSAIVVEPKDSDVVLHVMNQAGTESFSAGLGAASDTKSGVMTPSDHRRLQRASVTYTAKAVRGVESLPSGIVVSDASRSKLCYDIETNQLLLAYSRIPNQDPMFYQSWSIDENGNTTNDYRANGIIINAGSSLYAWDENAKSFAPMYGGGYDDTQVWNAIELLTKNTNDKLNRSTQSRQMHPLRLTGNCTDEDFPRRVEIGDTIDVSIEEPQFSYESDEVVWVCSSDNVTFERRGKNIHAVVGATNKFYLYAMIEGRPDTASDKLYIDIATAGATKAPKVSNLCYLENSAIGTARVRVTVGNFNPQNLTIAMMVEGTVWSRTKTKDDRWVDGTVTFTAIDIPIETTHSAQDITLRVTHSGKTQTFPIVRNGQVVI